MTRRSDRIEDRATGSTRTAAAEDREGDAREVVRLTYVMIDFAAGRVETAANFEAVMGYRLSSAASVDIAAAIRPAFARVVRRDRRRVAAALRQWRRGEAVDALAFSVIGPSADERRIESVCSLERSAGGAPSKAFVVLLDSTGQSRAEATLRESETRYRMALTAGRMGSWETDLVARTRSWSAEGMALFGLDLADGKGRIGGVADEYRRAMHPEDRHLAQRLRHLADQRDSFPAEYRIVRPDGTVLWLSGRGLVVARQPNGKAHRLVSIMADVTEHRQAEEVLLVERERLELALAAGQMGVYDLDIRNDVLWWSRQTYAVFGVSPETFKTTRESVIDLIHPDDRAVFIQRRTEAMAKRQPLVHEFRVVRADGTLAWVGHRGQTDYDADGRAVRNFGIAMDITERKQAEQALREADRKKDNFIATLAHELRNPLAPIRNAVNVLRQAGDADAQLAWCRDVIDRQVRQMTHLLEDLLDVSRLTRGRFPLRRGPLLFATVIEQAIEISKPVIDAAGHSLEIAQPELSPNVEGDLTRLAQVFSNLLINAAKYTPQAGRISLSVAAQGEEVVTTVSDTGIGIAATQLPHIFEMFGQVESALDRSQGGLGIGLSLAKGLIDMHGGRISARSEGVGKGSQFIVRLPILRQAAVAEVPARGHEAGSPAPQGRRILIADDLRDSADSLALLLDAMGHQVRVAYDGEQALQAVEEYRPDVVLLDLGMPRLNGFETCRRIREAPWGRGITLIAQTGWGQQEDRQRTRDAGFDHHVVKPLDPVALDALLRTIPVATTAGPGSISGAATAPASRWR